MEIELQPKAPPVAFFLDTPDAMWEAFKRLRERGFQGAVSCGQDGNGGERWFVTVNIKGDHRTAAEALLGQYLVADSTRAIVYKTAEEVAQLYDGAI